jgi:hypothetical protein
VVVEFVYTTVADFAVPGSVLHVTSACVAVQAFVYVWHNVVTVSVAVGQHYRVRRVRRRCVHTRDYQHHEINHEKHYHGSASALIMVVALHCCEEDHEEGTDKDVAGDLGELRSS